MRLAIMAPLVTAIREPQRGGSQAFVSDLARGLTGRGHDVHVYAASGSEIPGVDVIDTGVDPQSLAATLYRAFGPSPGGAAEAGPAAEAAFTTAYATVRLTRYDVIHNHAFDAPAVRLATALRAPVGGYGGKIASTGMTRRQAAAWHCDTVATAGGLPRWATWRSAADTASSGGRWSVCTTGARSAVASRTAGASKA